MEERDYYVGLSYIQGLGPQKFKMLMDHYGSAREIWRSSATQLSMIVGGKLGERIFSHCHNFKLENELKKIEKLKIRTVLTDDPDYPSLLREIYDPPFILYTKGLPLSTVSSLVIGVVGSRKCTPYGLANARRLSKELSERGITVASGMARGIDSAAHWGAIDGKGTTIAVLGCGLDQCYPSENRHLMQKICEQGAVVSEYPLGFPPLPLHFPARNRIISGLSKGILVIEACEKSGALITADFALEQGREVFALPGNITNPNSRGTNKLIQQGAKLIQSVNDILEDLGISVTRGNDTEEANPSIGMARNILEMLREPLEFGDLLNRLGLQAGELQAYLLELELDGQIRQLPGNVYIRI